LLGSCFREEGSAVLTVLAAEPLLAAPLAAAFFFSGAETGSMRNQSFLSTWTNP
jgi:hypothetical protein